MRLVDMYFWILGSACSWRLASFLCEAFAKKASVTRIPRGQSVRFSRAEKYTKISCANMSLQMPNIDVTEGGRTDGKCASTSATQSIVGRAATEAEQAAD